jgi:hypothetical protein
MLIIQWLFVIKVLMLVWTHWFADFVCQTDEMALNKSKSNKWLSIHVLVYSVCFIWMGWKFALINGICHWITDFITSRINSHLVKLESKHWFFTCIGFDQAIHITTLLLTMN